LTDLTSFWTPRRQMTKIMRRQMVKKSVFERDGGLCKYCGRDLDLDFDGNLPGVRVSPRIATVDHLLEKRKGGLYSKNNLWTSCGTCNGRRDALRMTPEEFIEWRKKNPTGPWPTHLKRKE
jgi:5-methylcytosine-specific restriction endonuclease McrA